MSMLDAYGICALANYLLDTGRLGLIHVQVADSDPDAAKGLIGSASKEGD
ncbi:hypothetical protein NKJ35_17770 [Mesorhizobium sp. M0136]